MPWVPRGLRNGVLTTGWPRRQDDYFNGFPAAIDVDLAEADERSSEARRAAEICPTDAITLTESGVRLDRGRCILCGRCAVVAPNVFRPESGSAVAVRSRGELVVGRTTETDEALSTLRAELDRRVKRLRRSVHIRHVDAGSDGSDDWEVQALVNPVYDIHRLGIFFTASPRHADILLVTGVGTNGMRQPLLRTRTAMPDPVVVIAAGTDAASGGLVGGGYTDGTGVGAVLDVDVWVPGSPASPFSLLHGILLALDRLPEIQSELGGSR
jgi:Ni,Fe-hydrogenase III small subunit/ferredoxin